MYNEDMTTEMMYTTQAPAVYQDKQEAIAILDIDGTICYLNSTWKKWVGGYTVDAQAFRIGNNYLAVIDAVFDPGSTYVEALAHALRMVLEGERDHVEIEYPSAFMGNWHWFLLEVTAHSVRGNRGLLVRQHDITEVLRRENGV